MERTLSGSKIFAKASYFEDANGGSKVVKSMDDLALLLGEAVFDDADEAATNLTTSPVYYGYLTESQGASRKLQLGTQTEQKSSRERSKKGAVSTNVLIEADESAFVKKRSISMPSSKLPVQSVCSLNVSSSAACGELPMPSGSQRAVLARSWKPDDFCPTEISSSQSLAAQTAKPIRALETIETLREAAAASSAVEAKPKKRRSGRLSTKSTDQKAANQKCSAGQNLRANEQQGTESGATWTAGMMERLRLVRCNLTYWTRKS